MVNSISHKIFLFFSILSMIDSFPVVFFGVKIFSSGTNPLLQ